MRSSHNRTTATTKTGTAQKATWTLYICNSVKSKSLIVYELKEVQKMETQIGQKKICEIKYTNLGTINRNRMSIGKLDLYFSYDTIVAFAEQGIITATAKKYSNTTSKFIDELQPNSDFRKEHKEFLELLQEALNRLSCEIAGSLLTTKEYRENRDIFALWKQTN
jgi:hypothetical protein